MDPVRHLFAETPTAPLTEARVREIVREEIEWALKIARPAANSSAHTSAAVRKLARNEAILASYQSGRTVRQCAAEHGVTDQTIYRVLANVGVRLHGFRSEADAATLRAIADDYRSGLTQLQCATKHGCTVTRVKRALSIHNVAARPPQCRGSAPDPRLLRMKEMRGQGATLEQIAAEFQISRERVRQLLNRAGVATAERPPTPQERAVVEEYVAGENIQVCAAKLGIDKNTFKRVVLRCGHVLRKDRARSRVVDERARRAAALKAEGKTIQEIAEIMGFKYPLYVYRHLDRAKGLAERETEQPT